MAVFHSHGLSLLLLVIRTECAGARLCLNEESTQVITATLDKVADLPCSISGLGDSGITVKWTKHSSKPEDIAVWTVNGSDTPERQRGVFKWGADGVRAGNMSLSLRGVNRSDEGSYICTVSRGHDCVFIKNITLKVKACEILQHVEVAHNQIATLPCSNRESENVRILDVSWGVIKGHSETVILQFPPDNSSTTSLAKRARFTGPPPSGKTSLVLLNVEYTDSQWYRCKLTTEQKQRCFDVKLLVKKQEYNPVVWTSTTTESEHMTDKSPGDTESRNLLSPEEVNTALLGNAMAATIALTTSIMVILAILLGVFIVLRRRRHSDATVSLSMSAPVDSLRHMYEKVDDFAMKTNSLYSDSQYYQNENFFTFKRQ